MTFRVGVDTGGTFTDLVAVDEATGRVVTAKAPSTPHEPAQAVFDVLAAAGIALADARTLVLGTTIATNSMLERRGAEVVYLTTAGFEDVPIIGRVDKEDPYDLHRQRPRPYVARRHCLGVRERVGPGGEVVEALDEAELERVAARLDALLPLVEGEPALAVNLLFSFAEPAHERLLASFLRRRFPELPVSVSSELAPVWRELERGSTTILDAYLKPVFRRLVDPLRLGLLERGVRGVSIMKSNGGQMPAELAGEQPVQSVLSGLAGGIVAGRYFGARAGSRSVLTLDMGGTSADVGIVRDGEVGYVTELELEFGIPIAVPAIDLVTVGAGGGSIAWIDDGGLLRVGPRSAGAIPGPACYGLGGTDPTVTDANLVLNRLDPAYFVGGKIALDERLAHESLARLGAGLGLSAVEAAHAVIDVATESMAVSIREVAVERGADPRDFDLVAFGGAGPLHAGAIAAALGIGTVIVPPHPGLASAFGALAADRRVDRRWTQYYRSDAVDLAAVGERLDELVAESLAALRAEGFDGSPTLLRSVSMRYAGQNYERDVPLPPGPLDPDGLAALLEAFHEHHRAVYGYAFPAETIELIHFNVTALGPSVPPELPEPAPALGSPEPHAVRAVEFAGRRALRTPVYRREQLGAGATIEGPAIVEEEDSTTLVLPGHELRVGAGGIVRIERRVQAGGAARGIDAVTMSVVGDQLAGIAREMGEYMMRSSYSPIFSESRDFSCALFDRRGQMIAQGRFCPAHLGAMPETVRCTLEELGVDSLEPGDVVIHNDPFRGGCHMPEHLLLRPVFHDGSLVALAATIGHMAEIGAMAVGSFAGDATEVYQEGLRLPPVKLVQRGERVDDVWKIILTNHRTPRATWGDLHAMIGSLLLAERRFVELLERYGPPALLETCDRLIEHGERLMRRRIAEIPDGDYAFEDVMEDDGITDDVRHIRVTVRVRGDRAIVDYTGTDPQARGPVNGTYGVAASAAFNAFLQISGTELPRNAGAYRSVKTIAPLGSLVNVRFPGPSVGGNTETQPKLVGMILGAFAPVLPDRVMAAEGVTSCNFLFGGIDPRTGAQYAHYHFEASGWGGRERGDGVSATNHIHGNCRNTPVEIFELRFPWRVRSYGLVADSGGPGRHRGGLAVRRVLEVRAPEVTVSSMMDRVKSGAWGLFGGGAGRCAAVLVRRRGEPSFRTFSAAFGTVSPSKFANIRLREGDEVVLESAGGGGFGDPFERNPELVRRDVLEGLVTLESAERDYGVSLDERLAVDAGRTAQLRSR